MRTRLLVCVFGLVVSAASVSHAAIFGAVTGVVQDPQHRPVPQADAIVHSPVSGWQQQTRTDDHGRFALTMVPVGEYIVSIAKPGFEVLDQPFVVRSNATTTLTLTLTIGAVSERVEVVGSEGAVNPRSVTTETLVTRDRIERAPGAVRTNSLDMVTQFVPGSYVVHDQLHVRGGHQVSWLVDGVPVPNTNIASNVGPQFDPKDIDTIEIQRGGYSAEFGDRTYGIFNVVTRSGFERDREAELVPNYGSYNETNDQFSFGDHSDKFAYYASVNANRTDLGLQTPVPESLHNQGTGVGGFGSLIYKSTDADQFRVVGSIRADHYEIPNTPEQEAEGIDDHQRERDGFVNASWLRTVGSRAFLTVSPFYHYNRAAFNGGSNDPIVTVDHRTSQYAGAQTVLAVSGGSHNGRVGAYGFYQHDSALFGLQSVEGGAALVQSQSPTGGVAVLFAEDQYTTRDWLTLHGGVRITHFSGDLTENAVSPRVGAAIRLPRWNWVARAFYGRYYQPPPLTTVSGPLLDVAAAEGFGFLPLKGERDEQYEVGLAIPLRGWTIDLSQFRTNARNFFDHDVIGNSNIFIPLTIDEARIRGFEAAVTSPRRSRGHVHLAYSHQFVEGRGGVTGGLTSFEPPSDGYYFLDHDQRDTLTIGGDVEVMRGAWISGSVEYGSGFLAGDGPDHEPGHVTFSVQVSKAVGKQWTLIATALNVADARFLLDESNTFGGTHYNSPRQISAGIRYRFHY